LPYSFTFSGTISTFAPSSSACAAISLRTTSTASTTSSKFWLERLGLPQSSLRKSVINVYSKHSRKKRQNKLPYGTCKLYVHSTRIQQTIYGSIQEYGGFERPEWLD
jgi:hypothetical protein